MNQTLEEDTSDRGPSDTPCLHHEGMEFRGQVFKNSLGKTFGNKTAL